MENTEIRVRGVARTLPCIVIDDRTLIVTGRFPKIAQIKDEDWIEGDIVPSPSRFCELIRSRNSGLKADLFTFGQKINNAIPRYPLSYRLDSIAAIPIISYYDWWTKRIGSHVRQDVNRASRRGITTRVVPFTEDLVRGIVDIYNETPIRQGRPYWHYGKDIGATWQMNSTYLDRSEFVGAFLGDELIGFLKMVYVDHIARLMQIIAKDAHRDKRPMNALIAKAVEVCEAKNRTHLIYGNYLYLQGPDSLTAFKHRNGFEEFLVPRYYVPLSRIGKLALSLHLERGPRAWVPPSVQESLRRVRASVYRHVRITPDEK
jgi:hypothetical protein